MDEKEEEELEAMMTEWLIPNKNISKLSLRLLEHICFVFINLRIQDKNLDGNTTQ